MRHIKLFEEYKVDDHATQVPGIGAVKFRSESRDYHDGQTYMTTYAYNSEGKWIGWCDWSEYEKEIGIEMIEVLPEYRRKGIATMIMDVRKTLE